MPSNINGYEHMYAIVRGAVNKFFPYIWSKELITKADCMTKDDLTQEIMLSLWEKHLNENLPFTMEEATKKYVHTRTYQLLVDIVRKRFPQILRVDDQTLEEMLLDDASENLASYEDVLSINDNMKSLSEKNLKIMSYVVLGYSYAEMSSLLESEGYMITPESLRTRVAIIRKKLRQANGE